MAFRFVSERASDTMSADPGISGGVSKAMAVLTLCAGLFACGKSTEGLPGESERRVVVERGSLSDQLVLTGVVDAKRQVQIKSEVSGPIRKILVEEGDSVSAGQDLVWIDTEQLEKKELRDRLALDRSRILWKQAERDRQSGESLLAVDGISRQEYQDLAWKVDLARIQVQEDSLAWSETRLQLRRSVVKAPTDGVLVSWDCKEGEVIVSGTASVGGGTTLGILADLTDLEVSVQVSELDYPHLAVGKSARVESEAFPGKTFAGRVTYLSRMAKEQEEKGLRRFEVRVAVTLAGAQEASTRPGGRRKQESGSDGEKAQAGPEVSEKPRGAAGEKGVGKPDGEKSGERNSVSLAPGMQVTVSFPLFSLDGVLTLPYDAVQTSERGGSAVWIPGKAGAPAERKRVRTGATNFARIEIVEGLAEGDTVVVRARGGAPRGGAGGGH